MNDYARMLFEQLDKNLDRHALRIRNHVFSIYRDVGFEPEHYERLLPMVREELEALVTRILEDFDNVGSVLPEGVLGYSIGALPDIVNVGEDGPQQTTRSAEDRVELRDGGQDYYSMWWDYLEAKKPGDEQG